MKKRLTIQDLDRAKRNPAAMREFNRKGAKAAMLPMETLRRVRELAMETMPIMRAQGKKITPEAWYRRLVNILKSRNPEVRNTIISQLEARDADKK
jgi:hypothetical protein